ncbi:histidine kinase dimerization/phospho-acceptor domain-containing protein, partial [uncultured Nocardioides sp.]|uniref:histidine kinase dimerization/phospho-acceptor domain-containing protein n=1 Tax=uncultured Nocardioides sp. TaxID=198441 RepID=UPI0026097148
MGHSAWLGAVVDATTDGLWVLDRDGTTVWANDAMAALLRREPGSMTGLPARDVFPADQGARVDMHVSMLRRGTRGRDNLPVTLRRSDASLVDGLLSYSPVRQDGRITGWLHRFTPYAVTAPAPPAAAPAGAVGAAPVADPEAEARARQLSEAQEIAGIGSFTWDLDTGVVTWSEQLHRLYGVPPADFDGTFEAFVACLHPDDREHVRLVTEAALRERHSFEFDARVLRPDGDVRWVHGRCRLTRDPATGRPVRMDGTNQDITEVRRAEVSASAASRRLRLMQQMATAANRARTLVEAIEVAAVRLPEHTGWQPVAGWLVSAAGGPRQDRVVELEQVYPATTAHPAATDLAEQCLVDGRVAQDARSIEGRPFSRVALPVVVEEEVVAVLEVLADEAPLSEPAHDLVQQVAAQLGVVAERERAAEALADARDRAMEASRMKSEFLATMSHEIRTPMNGVIGLNELLLRTELDDHQRRLADGVHQSGLSLLAIINDILDLSKIEAGKLELEDVDFEVRSVFEQTASVLASPAH